MAAGPRSNTPITPLTPSSSNRTVYQPASAGSAPRVAAAAGPATPYSSSESEEVYSDNFESESPSARSEGSYVAY
jgi:hypothetical protein